MLSKSLSLMLRVVFVVVALVCPSVEPGPWVSVAEKQPVVVATEVIKEAGFQIRIARHRVYFTSKGKDLEQKAK